jgi:cytochrome c553
MLFALTTGHKIGLAAVGIAFIVFALVSSFVMPRRDPNFPGRRVGWFVLVTVGFFLAMMAAVLVFGREAKTESEGSGGAAPTETKAAGGGGGGGGGGPYANGDAAAGKAVFASAGCNGCHTLKAAGASGTLGPSLDAKKPPRALIIERVTKGKAPMPAFKGQLSDKQIADVVAFVYTSTHS